MNTKPRTRGSNHGGWHGPKVTAARKKLAATTHWPTACARCGRAVTPDNWRLGHKVDRQARPDLAWEEWNWQVECVTCSARSGAVQGNTRRGLAQRLAKSGGDFFEGRVPQAPPLTEFVSEKSRFLPVTLSKSPRHPGEHDGLPRMFPDPHPDAVASLGDEFAAFVERDTGTMLRWWQWLTAQRRYEVDAQGRWCWTRVWTSVPRQQGKSVELARDGVWHGSLGRRALALHTAHRVATSRDVQAEMWHWAGERDLDVAKQLGDSRITWPDGSVWKTLAMESAYSQRPRRLMVDEAWAMQPVPFWNALWPALSGQDETVQALFWSCANPEDKGLAADLRADAAVCRMEWGALPGEDPLDPVVWRAATAHWNPGREALMAAASTRPGFAENWLNVWPLSAAASAWGAPLAGMLPQPSTPVWSGPVVGAVESDPGGASWGVAVSDGVRVEVAAVGRLAEALSWLAARGPVRVVAHQSVVGQVHDDAWVGLLVAVSRVQAASATAVLRDSVRSLAWSGVLAEQLGRARVSAPGGVEQIDAVASDGSVAGVKAAAWCLWSARADRAQAPAIW